MHCEFRLPNQREFQIWHDRLAKRNLVTFCSLVLACCVPYILRVESVCNKRWYLQTINLTESLIVSLYFMFLRLQLREYEQKFSNGVDVIFSGPLKIFGLSLLALVCLNMTLAILTFISSKMNDEIRKLRYNISIFSLMIVMVLLMEVPIGCFIYMTLKYTTPLTEKVSKLAAQMQRLPRQSKGAEERKEEGQRREAWVAMFGTMQGYTTEWHDVNGWNYLYGDQSHTIATNKPKKDDVNIL